MQTHNDLEQYILTLPGAFLDYPFGPGVAVYKVKVGKSDKMFALIGEDNDPLTISLKAKPDDAVEQRLNHSFIKPGYHLNKKHWNTVTIMGDCPDKLINQLILDSYLLVNPKAVFLNKPHN